MTGRKSMTTMREGNLVRVYTYDPINRVAEASAIRYNSDGSIRSISGNTQPAQEYLSAQVQVGLASLKDNK